MDLKALQKAIHDTAMAVRAGDWAQFEKLKELRRQHRAACGVPEPKAAPAPTFAAAAPEATEAPAKKQGKKASAKRDEATSAADE